MSVLHLEVCPICGAEYGLVRHTTKSGGLSQITYVCGECDSVLLWLGDDLWLQGDRWAYQRVGRKDRAYLLHASLTVKELQQLATQVQSASGGESPAASAWQASENGWEAVPSEAEWTNAPESDPSDAAAGSDQDARFEESSMEPASEAEVSAEYEWLEIPVAVPDDDATPTGDAWFDEPSTESAGEAASPPEDAWFEAPAPIPKEEPAEPADDGWFEEPLAAAAAAAATATAAATAEAATDDWFDEPSSMPQPPDRAVPAPQRTAGPPPASGRRGRGSPFLVVSIVLTMLCLFVSAAVMIVSTTMSGRPPQGAALTNLPPSTASPTEAPIPTATPMATEQVPVPAATPEVEFQGVSSYVAGTGSHYVVGEVLNRTGENLRFVEILASFYDGGGQLISTGSTFAELSVIEPGGAAPFKLATLDPPPSLADYKLRADFLTSGVAPLGLEVLNHSASVSDTGWYHISGEVRNAHDFAVKFPEIVATYYNPSHQVVRVEMDFAELEVMQPGEVSRFEIVLVEPPVDLHHYALQTEAIRE